MGQVSELDDELLSRIISLLPLKDMLRTSLLSRRWRHVWTTARAFDFTGAASFNTDVYISRIDHCLEQLSASPSCMTIPNILFPSIQDPDVADRWIRFAAAHNVVRLEFAIWIGGYSPPIPLSLSRFELCHRLTSLDISGYEIPAVPAPAISPALPSLRSLSLFDVIIADPQAIFAQCPAIERLSVELSDDDYLLPASAFRSCPLLSTLSLSFCTVPREPPSAGPPTFPSLRALELEIVHVAAPQSLLNSCPVIAELTIRNPPEGFAFRLDPRHTVSTLRIFSQAVPRLSLPSLSLSPSLRTLVLFGLEIANPSALIRAFQGLEHLLLERVRIEQGANSGIQVRAPRMRHLMVQDSTGLGLVAVADIPQLCRLFYWGDIRYLRVFKRAVPNLEEAFLHSTVENPFGGKYQLWKNLMQPLSHVRLLSVNWWFIREKVMIITYVSTNTSFNFQIYDPIHLPQENADSLVAIMGEIFSVMPKFMQGCPVGSEQLIFDKLKEFHWWPVFKKSAVDSFQQYTKRLSPMVVLSLLDFLKCCPNVQHLCIVSTYAIPESPPPAVPSAEENEDEFLIKMENSIDFNQTKGLQIVQRALDVGQGSLPQLKKFTMYQFSGGPRDMCLLYFVGLRACALQHIHLHCVKGSRGATHRIQSSVHHYFSICSPHAILQFSECSSDETCPRHAELWMYELYD